MPNSKMIIGLAGEIASGKTTVTDYLKEKYDAVTFRFSDPLRDVAKRLRLPETRANLQSLSTVLRQNFGEDLLSKVLAADAGESAEQLIITEGVRRPTDIIYLKELPGFFLLAISADPRLRFERLARRRENPDDQKKTWEEFQADGQREPEQKIKTIAAQARFKIDNNGSKEELFVQIDALLEKLRHEN